ncbi:histidinol-phosphate transaminase [Polymorphobacter fuscus]|uniref:Histidinol-phosphate aminotransferase n=1 Tax=Sandarakinorhabdus fusca TaxID=1439888 RepID=A0A7C9GTG5_9SPHN|nr:histidinol-phosphate transaminase [Polymorphobacter fuscus]KAB7643933.1 histidinol-phosphate transaminase [Polymorphobacter fuscus]MQT18591.1 histidinol-phosphate transaminase [Polymorphobacter fuscus]
MTRPAPRMKSYVADLHAYVPGKAGLGGRPVVAKLSSNENPFGPSPQAIAAMTAVLENSNRYPDPASTALREALGAAHGIEADRVICGTGSDELLHLVAGAFAGVGDEVLYVRHGFAVYDIAARRVGATPVVAPDDDYACNVDTLLAAVTPRTRVVFLANPNNPTGTLIPASEVRRLHAGLPADCVFALDAAYAEFAEGEYEDGLALARAHANVIALRTFSKIYGLAAQRVGWAYAQPGIIDAMQRIRAPFNVPTTGQVGAIAALADTGWVERARAHTIQWRQWLAGEVTALGNAGLRAIPSAANFVLVEFPEHGPVTAAAANAALLEDGIITRYLAVQDMPRCIRISVGTEDETRAAAAALRRFVETATA